MRTKVHSTIKASLAASVWLPILKKEGRVEPVGNKATISSFLKKPIFF
jgi:hypothetical protein